MTDAFKDYLQLAVKSLKKRRLRSFLTMVGIFIGIAAVVSLISLGQGLEDSILQEFEALGGDKITIQPKGVSFGLPGVSTPTKLTDNDLREVRNTRGVKDVVGFNTRSARVEFHDQLQFQFVSGMPTDESRRIIESLQGFDIMRGRNLASGDDNNAVVGYDYTQEDVFEQTLDVGDTVTVEGREFDIIGIQEKIGNPIDDRAVLITKETHDDLFDIREEFDFLFAQTQPGADIGATAERVEESLRDSRDLDEGDEDFEVQTPEELLESFNTILLVVQIVVIGIASISLVVGGIGIMNTMYTSVLERTREIGVMKAVGARNEDILYIFLLESGLLGLIGGVVGVILGVGLSSGAAAIGRQTGIELFRASFSPFLIIGTLVFSIVIGTLSGILPARQASKLQPVDALRYE